MMSFVQTLSHLRRLPNKLLLQWALRGNNVECICCGRTALSFLPAGYKKRPHAKCVYCNALERHRLLWHYLQTEKKIQLFSGKLLHIAPERIFYDKLYPLLSANYFPVDLEPDANKHGGQTKPMDVTKMNFSDNFFDGIICNHVLEHIPDDRKAMQEIYRVLKPGAWALLNVPIDATRKATYEDFKITDPQQRLSVFGQQDHVRIYGTDYTERLKQSGFYVHEVIYADRFVPEEIFRYGVRKEPIFECSKI